MKAKGLPLLFLATVAGLFACVPGSQPPPPLPRDHPIFQGSFRPGPILKIGSIASAPAKERVLFEPLLSYMAGRLEPAGIVGVVLAVTNTMDEMASSLRKGEVDLFIDSPFPVMTVANASGARPFLRRWKGGVASSRSSIFVRADGPVQTLAQLEGQTIAFRNATATTSYFLPWAAMVEADLVVPPCTTGTPQQVPGGVGCTFTGDDETSAFWVLEGRVIGAAMDRPNIERYAGQRIGDLRFLARSEELPRHLVAHRKDLPPDLLAAIASLLLAMEHDPQGREALAAFERTTRFEALTVDDLDRLSAFAQQVEGSERQPAAPAGGLLP